MAIHSPLRYRRLNADRTEATHQLIAFRLRQEWFALPIDDVQKVVQMGKIYGDPQGTGVSLTEYQDRELLVIDVSQRIFAEAPSANTNLGEATQVRFLAIVQGDTGDLVGLPIDSPPAIHRVPESAFSPLPSSYVAQGNIQCISSTMVRLDNRQPLFLLDRNSLLQT
ncbi:MAG: chemotaxis protein CheW [Cyanosarcina radialis HA8281-LM2]|jgi:purine-binding chemotaxis protein CheW|nr:chemotaxis protein CheW [Cyanosarcina radialis HA8281-LM2]